MSVDFPNEPVGFTQISSNPLTVHPEVYGTTDMPPVTWGAWPGGDIVTEGSEPLSSPYSWRATFPVGFPGGVSPVQAWAYFYNGPGGEWVGYNEVFYGYWFKFSANMEQHPAQARKTSFLWLHDWPLETKGQLFTAVQGPQGGPYYIAQYLEYVTSNGHIPGTWGDDPGTRVLPGYGTAFTPGVWHRLEAYHKKSTTSTSQDGVLTWWLNGTLAGHYTTINVPELNTFAYWEWTPVWGGNGNTKTVTDYLWLDHVYLSTGEAPANPPPVGIPLLTVR